MLEKIRSLGTDTAIYGISTILGRFLTFILTPLYTHALSPAEVGVVALVYTYLAFLQVLYHYGMESSFFRYAATLEVGTKKENFTTPLISLGVTSVVFSVLIIVLADPLAQWSSIPAGAESIVYAAAIILLCDSIAVVPFAALRLERKATRFAMVKLANIIIQVGCTILFLFILRMGLEGIFIAGLIASVATILMLMPTIRENFFLPIKTDLLRHLLRFGLPYIPAGLATMMIQVVDRPILEALTDTATVGIYQVNYRLGIFMMLVVLAFDYAWRPFFMTYSQEHDAKGLFARVLTYFFLFMVFVFLALSFFLDDLVSMPIFFGRTLIESQYWQGLSIVPVVLLGYLFLGISNNLVAGIYIEKKTHHLPMITFIGVGVSIATNLLLIPSMGIMGAAIATCASYAVMTAVLFVLAQRFYPVHYEYARLGKIAIAGAVVFGIYAAVDWTDGNVVWEMALVVLFVIIMYLLKFFNPSETRILSRLFERPAKPINPADSSID